MVTPEEQLKQWITERLREWDRDDDHEDNPRVYKLTLDIVSTCGAMGLIGEDIEAYTKAVVDANVFYSEY